MVNRFMYSLEESKQRITDKYPAPLAAGFNRCFGKGARGTGTELVEYYDYIMTFLGGIGAAEYIRQGAVSPRENLFLISSLRSMNTEKWVEVLRGTIPITGKDSNLPGLFELYRSGRFLGIDFTGRFEYFRRRAGLEFMPMDREETSVIESMIMDLLEGIGFLAKYSLITNMGGSSYLLRGSGDPAKTAPAGDAAPGTVVLVSPDKKKIINLSPFIIPSPDGKDIQFADFREDKNLYHQFIKIPAVALQVEEYKNILAGKPSFSEVEKTSAVDFLSPDFKQSLVKLIEYPSVQRIMVEAPPGGGKTMLIAGLDKILDTSRHKLIRYYLEDRSLICSTIVFSRFLYLELNRALPAPHKPVMTGEGWNNFRKNVINDIARSGQSIVIAVDAIDSAVTSNSGEKVTIDQYLKMKFPRNVTLLMTTRTGDYPCPFEAHLKMPVLSSEEIKALPGGESLDETQISLLLDDYGGNAGYIREILQEKSVGEKKLPELIVKSFREIISRYDLLCPIREKICRHLAISPEPVRVGRICGDLDIYISDIIDHIRAIQPILGVENPGYEEAYHLFIPAFSKYILEMTGGKSREETIK